jgi:hypothetical protein
VARGFWYLRVVEADEFDEEAFVLALSSVRALLIGRRALVALGLPVLTADYDVWLHIDDIEALNAKLEPLGLAPNRTPTEARQKGRYVLENGEHVDVMVARVVSTVDGARVAFDDIWPRRQAVAYTQRASIVIPSLDDLIATKRFGGRARDIADIEYLEALKRSSS